MLVFPIGHANADDMTMYILFHDKSFGMMKKRLFLKIISYIWTIIQTLVSEKSF